MLEAGPISRLRPLVVPATWTIDVGANIGVFSLRFAHWVGPSGQVVAIEPETINFASLRRRLAASGHEDRVITIQAVAAEAAGLLHLQVNPNHPGDHRIAADGVPIDAVTLDGVLAGHNDPPVSLIKIDVQGAELRVLHGAVGIIERCHPALFIEVDDDALRMQGATVHELIAFLAGFSYRPYRLTRFGAPQPIPAESLGRGSYEDVLFLAPMRGKIAKAP